MALATLLRKLAGEHGVELDADELESLGLSDETETEPETEPGGSSAEPDDILSIPLPGTAAGQVELFLAASSTTVAKPSQVDGDGLMWYPIIREGQWAVRPGTAGQKRRVPLKVVAGKSKNQRKQIGLQDLLDAHEAQAVQHVTVPTSHNNTLVENQGFIDKMKIVDGTVKPKGSKKEIPVKVLMGGYRITEPETKGKLERGTYANRSAGILYDYVDTETGKTWPAVVEHVALTNKPWITGMVSFGRKLQQGTADPVKVQTVPLSLSDDGPDDEEYTLALAEELELSSDDQDFLAVTGAVWDHENSPNWLQCQVNDILSAARAAKMDKVRAAKGDTVSYSYDYPPSYRCVEARPGQCLIADGWGDNANTWVAPISVKDGVVELADFEQWQAVKKAYMPDDRPAPEKDKLPLSGEGDQEAAARPKTRLQLAQERRRTRARPDNPTPREVVDDNMAGDNGNTDTLQLSQEARDLIARLETQNAALAKSNETLSEQVGRLTGTVGKNETDTYINWLKSDEGLGLSEERGFGGVLVEIRQLMLADDGEPAVQSDHFAQDGGSGELTLSDALKRVFGAFKTVTEGKKSLGEAFSEPTDAHEPDASAGKDGKDGETLSTDAGKDGKPDTLPAGKPPADATPEENLSDEERVTRVVDASLQADGALAEVLGRRAKASAPSNGSAGGEK